jgi:hypothetical protein
MGGGVIFAFILPKKEVRALKCYGITENMDIKQAYLKVS